MTARQLTAFDIIVQSPVIKEGVLIHGIHSRSDREDAPVILLLHGFPQSLAIWSEVAVALANRFHVVATDLRGYGSSSKPPPGNADAAYSKRELANDQLQVMQALGYQKFYVLAHDRGARVAHRLALDHPENVLKMILLDICPTLYMYNHTDLQYAVNYWHWFFLIVDSPLPESMIRKDPSAFCSLYFRKATTKFDPTSLSTYLEASEDQGWPEAVAGDYRASKPGGVDLTLDKADLDRGHKLSVPIRVLIGKHGVVPMFDIHEAWSQVCNEGMFHGFEMVESDHYIPEAVPQVVEAEVDKFFV